MCYIHELEKVLRFIQRRVKTARIARESDVMIQRLSILKIQLSGAWRLPSIQYYSTSNTVITSPQSSGMSPYRQWSFFAFDICNTTVHSLVNSARVHRGACQAKVRY